VVDPERGAAPGSLVVLGVLLRGGVDVDAVGLEHAAALDGHFEQARGHLLVPAVHPYDGRAEGLQPAYRRRRPALSRRRLVGRGLARTGHHHSRDGESAHHRPGGETDRSTPAQGPRRERSKHRIPFRAGPVDVGGTVPPAESPAPRAPVAMPGILRRPRTALTGDRVGRVIRSAIVIARRLESRAYR